MLSRITGRVRSSKLIARLLADRGVAHPIQRGRHWAAACQQAFLRRSDANYAQLYDLLFARSDQSSPLRQLSTRPHVRG